MAVASIVVDITVTIIVDIEAVRIVGVVVHTIVIVSKEKHVTPFPNPSSSMTTLKHS